MTDTKWLELNLIHQIDEHNTRFVLFVLYVEACMFGMYL